jgi:GntR family transcriptional regulator/MocR family aminotransferase
MLTFFLDKKSDSALYEQLYEQIKLAIAEGKLKKNEKMPSKRKLASHLKISQTTIESAYNQLLAEGYINSVPKVGYFVTTDLELLSNRKHLPIQGYEKIKGDEFLVDFKTNQVDNESFPYEKFAKIERDVILDNLKNNLNRGESFGVYEFRKKIAEILFSYRGIKALPEQIIVGSGSEHLILLMTLMLGKDKTYAVEDPSYIKNYLLYQAYGVRVKTIQLDEEGISLDELMKQKCDVVHATPSHQFPSGIVTPVKRRMELLRWANENNSRYIIEDDYDSEFRFSGNPIPALKSLDKFDKVIYMNSFSKTLAPAFRISFMVLPANLIKVYHDNLGFFSSSVPTTNQLILERFIALGEYEKHLNRMKNNYKQKRDYLLKLLLESDIKEKLVVMGEEAGLHFLIRIKTDKKEKDLVEMAKEKGLRVYGLYEYFIEKPRDEIIKTIVFGYSNLSFKQMQEGVQLLSLAWKNI